jgi:CRISPR-associated exonuclease Cas4
MDFAVNGFNMEVSVEENNHGEGFGLTASDILEYLYCPRFTYFELYLKIPEHQEKRFKVQKGRTVHEDKERINPDYLRKKLGCVERKTSVYLSSTWGIKGIVDEILFLNDGTAAPLDYKYAEYKDQIFKNHRYQLTFYGRLIQENYQAPVNRGYIVYTRSRNKLIEVPITEKMFVELERIVADLLKVVVKGIYPDATQYKARCADCCYRNICEKVI